MSFNFDRSHIMTAWVAFQHTRFPFDSPPFTTSAMHPIVLQIAVVAWSILLPYLAPSHQTVFLHKLLLPTRVTSKYLSPSLSYPSPIKADTQAPGNFYKGTPTISVDTFQPWTRYVLTVMILFTSISLWILSSKVVIVFLQKLPDSCTNFQFLKLSMRKNEHEYRSVASLMDIDSSPSICVKSCDQYSFETHCQKPRVIATETGQENATLNNIWGSFGVGSLSPGESKSASLVESTIQSDPSKIDRYNTRVR